MKKNILLSIILPINLLVVTAQTWQLVGAQGFSPPVTQYSLTSLVLDQNGSPYVAFADASNSDKISVMKFDGSAWVLVGSANFSAGQGYDMSIAIDNNNLPWVAYGDGGNSSHATVMKFNGTSWVNVGAVGFSDGVVNNCTIKFDGSYTPYVAYVDASHSGKAVVKKFDGSNWVNVGTPGFTAGGTGQMTMALNHNGAPYVGYQDQANGFAESVMMYNGSNWVHVGAATFSNGTCQFTHITFDSAGVVPYVCYNAGFGTFSPNVQMFNGSSWQYVGGQNLNTDQDYQNNIAIGGSNTPYVIFPDGSYNSRATVMKYNGSSWVTVGNAGFSTGGEIWYPNIAIDAWNNVYVEYHDDGDSHKVSVMKFGNFGPTNNLTAKFTASDTVICQNSSVTFTDQSLGSPNSWHWTFSGGLPGNSNAQNPAVVFDTPGNYDIKLVVSNAGGTDSVTKTAYIKVSALPVLGSIVATPDTVCSGILVQLKTTGSSGSLQWQSSLTNSNFQNINNAVDSSYLISTIAPFYFRLIATNGVCSDTSVSKNVVVNAPGHAGNISASSDTVCSGGSVQLNTVGSAGNLQWQSSATNSNFQNINDATDSTVIISPVSSTIYFRLIAVNGTCPDTSGAHMIVVNALPSIPVLSVSDSIICASDSALIQSSGPYTSYEWSTGDTTNSVYVHSAGDYWVTVKDANGCSVASEHQNLSVYPAPFVSISSSGDTLFSHSAVSYQWHNENGLILGATDSLYIANETGDYSVQITDTNGCSAQSNTAHVVVTANDGVGDDASVNIYPNPFSANIIIVMQKRGVSPEVITITNTLGQQVACIIEKTANNKILNLSYLPNGIYFLQIEAGGEKIVKRVLKQ